MSLTAGQATLPEWVQWVQAIGPLITATATVCIGAIVAFIAWRQHRTAHEKLILDLFEKRLSIYQRVDDQMRSLAKPGNIVEADISRELLRIIAQARFLFGDDVIQELDLLRQHTRSARRAFSDFDTPEDIMGEEERDKILDEHIQRMTAWRKACVPYMRMTQKLP